MVAVTLLIAIVVPFPFKNFHDIFFASLLLQRPVRHKLVNLMCVGGCKYPPTAVGVWTIKNATKLRDLQP